MASAFGLEKARASHRSRFILIYQTPSSIVGSWAWKHSYKKACPKKTQPQSHTSSPSSLHHTPQVLPMANHNTLSTTAPKRARLRGVVFDMDGTLTVPAIDFAAMHRALLGEKEYIRIRAQNPSGIDILHHIESWSPQKQQKAYQTIADFERQGFQIMPGAADLCGFLDSKNIRRGLITRNVKAAVDLFHERFKLSFTPALGSEYRPCKPDPAPLLHICSAWEVEPCQVMMVGDSLKDDVVCGKRAGAFTCLLDEGGRYDFPEYANADYKPDFKVSSLTEVQSLLEAHFDLSP